VGGDLEKCIDSVLAKLKTLPEPPRDPRLEGRAWESLEWQRLKRLIARSIASCLCRILGCSVYIGDFHGGEPSAGLGGKDIDLVLNCELDEEALAVLEKLLEAKLAELLRRVFRRDPYSYLGIPNIVELHSTGEYLFKKYVERGMPYVQRLC